MIYFCSHKERRASVLQHPTLNGIDFLEVCTDEPGCDCGKILVLTFLRDARSISLDASHIRLSGGASDRAQIAIASIDPISDSSPRVLTIHLAHPGDFSVYTLALVATAKTDDPPDGIDPQLSSVTFSFKIQCATEADCLAETCCPPEHTPEPDINYLARDYEAFRQVILDRMAVLTPGWTETHAADPGIALVETLAYMADHLSYQQDAVATEAYLGTARSRASLRRHARLVDYRIAEGSNARAWIHVAAAGYAVPLASGTPIYPRIPGLPSVVSPSSPAARELTSDLSLAFATMAPALLYGEQNEMHLYTWGDTGCCLPPGATEATLVDTRDSLAPGTVLLFEEVLGPKSGSPADADPSHRWAVRLTSVRTTDYARRILTDPLTGIAITSIRWAPEDALPFPVCISSTTDAEHRARPLSRVSVVRGNMVPADHGTWLPPEILPVVPDAPAPPATSRSCTCTSTDTVAPPHPRFYPQLAHSPLTFAAELDPSAPASSFLSGSASAPAPQITLTDDQETAWPILSDLLSPPSSRASAVVEVESDGAASLRFGDGEYGLAPETGAIFTAVYRIGNGSAGNVGQDSLTHILTDDPAILSVRNPIAAAGGADPESPASIRQHAPFSFRTQLRAVTEADYAEMATRDPAISEARGTLRWTGSWYTAFVSVDTPTTASPGPALIKATKHRLNTFRMVGTDLEVEGAIVVGLRIVLSICVDPTHFQSDVRAALMRVFLTGDQCSGAPGLLDAGNFTFGETIYTSSLIAAAQTVEGVSSVTLSSFGRMDDPSTDLAGAGYLTLGRLEIARCDNDPNRLDHGSFKLNLDGGK